MLNDADVDSVGRRTRMTDGSPEASQATRMRLRPVATTERASLSMTALAS